MRSFRVTLTATLAPVEHEPVKGRGKSPQYVQRAIRILVYGFCSEQDEVAKALSQGDFYLQDPSVDEIDAGVPYHNPQYLLRPGTSMPATVGFVLSGNKSSQPTTDIVSESEKSRLLQIFETETKTTGIIGFQSSPRIQTCLKE